jgi:hypothetical protein
MPRYTKLVPGRWERESGHLDENGDQIGREGTHFEVGGAFAEFKGADYSVADNVEAHGLDCGRAIEIIGIAGELDVFVLGLTDELEPATGYGMAGTMPAALGIRLTRKDASASLRWEMTVLWVASGDFSPYGRRHNWWNCWRVEDQVESGLTSAEVSGWPS